ncbi:MAG: M13 family metallopeptidase [Muribaculaceae bacterium]|nr:M13 family metallopeptidase [Muribaculaceae bacterium]
MNNKHGINSDHLDTSIRLQDDFYGYANGGWLKENPLQGEYARFGVFDKIREEARLQLKELILNLRENPESKVNGTIEQKISDIYDLGMDEKRLNEEAEKPVMKLVEEMMNLPLSTPADFARMMAWLHLGPAGAFFGTGAGPDFEDSNIHILFVGEGGLTLGDRDYYLVENEANAKIMEAFRKYVFRLMELIGKSDEEQKRIWESVIYIEHSIAEHKMTREDRRDPTNTFNPMSEKELLEKYPGIDWMTYFNAIGIENERRLNISSPNYMEFVNKFVNTLSEEQLRDFLTYKIVMNAAGLLSNDFEEADFELFDRAMSGKEEMQPRWKRAMAIPNSMFGEAVGQLYVKKYFPEENKRYMTELIENLRKALASHISNLDWMSDETKEKALEKLSSMKVKIGYPDKWKDYSELSINPELSYLENVLNASRWFIRDNYNDLKKPVDKTEWHMTPQTVNAYYSPLNNEICFPAGILQAPYFDINADDACNYGAIGVVIGHEMTHGFDDQGRRYDANGNLNEWWTAEDTTRFKEKTDRLVKQFNEVEVLPGVHANGLFTLGENIADQGGLRVARTAYEMSGANLDAVGDDGFSALQRFYLAYAGVWANNVRDEYLRESVQTDPHSPGKLRVNETLKNITPFIDAFGIKEGDEMFRPLNERVEIW